jgi:hypothetical protein
LFALPAVFKPWMDLSISSRRLACWAQWNLAVAWTSMILGTNENSDSLVWTCVTVTFYVTLHYDGGLAWQENYFESQARWWLEQSEVRSQRDFQVPENQHLQQDCLPSFIISSSKTFEQADWTDDIAQFVVNLEACLITRYNSRGSENPSLIEDALRRLGVAFFFSRTRQSVAVAGNHCWLESFSIDDWVWRSGIQGSGPWAWRVEQERWQELVQVITLNCSISFPNSRVAASKLMDAPAKQVPRLICWGHRLAVGSLALQIEYAWLAMGFLLSHHHQSFSFFPPYLPPHSFAFSLSKLKNGHCQFPLSFLYTYLDLGPCNRSWAVVCYQICPPRGFTPRRPSGYCPSGIWMSIGPIC